MKLLFAVLLTSACAQALSAQVRPNLSGVWQLQASESRMVGAGGRVGPGPATRQIVWIITHREPRIRVVVNVRDSASSTEFTFECTTDGSPCVNELRQIHEVRRMSARWRGDTLHMTQRAESPRGGFHAEDFLHLGEGGETLVFNRTITDARGERRIVQVLRRRAHHPSVR